MNDDNLDNSIFHSSSNSDERKEIRDNDLIMDVILPNYKDQVTSSAIPVDNVGYINQGQIQVQSNADNDDSILSSLDETFSSQFLQHNGNVHLLEHYDIDHHDQNVGRIENDNRKINVRPNNIAVFESIRGIDWINDDNNSNEYSSNDENISIGNEPSSSSINNNNTIIPVAAEVVLEESSKDTPLVHATLIRTVNPNKRIKLMIALFFLVAVVVSVVFIVQKYNENKNTFNTISGFKSSKNEDKHNQTLLPSLAEEVEWLKLGGSIKEGLAGESVAVSQSGTTIAAIVQTGLWLPVGWNGTENFDDTYVNIYRYEHLTWSKIAQIKEQGQGIENGCQPEQRLALNAAGSVVAIGISGVVRAFDIDTSAIGYSDYGNECNCRQKGSNITSIDSLSGFGNTIDLSGDGNIIAISSTACYVQTFIYSEEDYEWLQHGQQINCSRNDTTVSPELPVKLSGDGSVLAVGEPNDPGLDGDLILASHGSISIYKFDGTDWVQLGQTIKGAVPGDQFGAAVAISNNGQIVASCAPYNKGLCSVYYYNSAIKSWQQLGLDIEGSALLDYFGSSVSLDDSGNRIAIGAVGGPKYGDYGTEDVNQEEDSGYVRILEYDTSDDTWHQLGQDIICPYTSFFIFPSVALSARGDVVTILSPEDEKAHGGAHIYETGIMAAKGGIPVIIEIHTNIYPEEIEWSIDRLDTELDETVQVVSVHAGTYSIANHTERTIVNATDGGVYRFSIVQVPIGGTYRYYEDKWDHEYANFSVQVNDLHIVGPVFNPDYYQHTFLVDSRATTESNRKEKSGTAFVTLSIDFDAHPYDIHWVMIKNSYDSNGKQVLNNRTVLAFGPTIEYQSNLSGSQYTEIIDVSSVTRNDVLSFILTDDGRDGLCCDYGSGLIRLYNGTVNYQSTANSTTSKDNRNHNKLIFETNAKEKKRWFTNFHLYD